VVGDDDHIGFQVRILAHDLLLGEFLDIGAQQDFPAGEFNQADESRIVVAELLLIRQFPSRPQRLNACRPNTEGLRQLVH
jgi:hypothetical protein